MEVIGEPMYQLHASIVHLGKSAGAGHYICYCNRGGKWIYYNDRKVCISDMPEIEKGFMFILKRLDK